MNKPDDRREQFWDAVEEKKSKRIKRIPRRPAEKLAFPLRPEKALILMTTQPTVRKARESYRAYRVAWRQTQDPKYWDKADEDVNRALANPWSEQDFWDDAVRFWQLPRRNFRPSAKRTEKFLQKISSAGIKTPRLENWTPTYSSDGKRLQ